MRALCSLYLYNIDKDTFQQFGWFYNLESGQISFSISVSFEGAEQVYVKITVWNKEKMEIVI